ncbi:MAG TPA: TolC family protein, partial [Pseudobdellovibrionaceae bacterium]|nr:TolC family protein [Pseudobdellovibrionaceae bacterium]
MNNHLRFAALVLLAAVTPISVQAMSLEEYLGQVVQKHQGLEGLRASEEAARKTREAGDLELTPRFNIQGSYLSDKKRPGMLGADENRSEAYSATLSKLFSTGTHVGVTAKTVGVETLGLNPAIVPLVGASSYAQGGLGLSLSQSLWKNAFGRSTNLRREREMTVAEAEAGSYDLQSRQILASAETAFWDLLYLQEEVSIRQASLERGKKLEAWFRRRAEDGISDRADTLNARALVASRELQLAASKDNLIAAEKKVRDYLEIDEAQVVPVLTGRIGSSREPERMLGREGRIVSLQVYLADLQAKAQTVGARDAEEATK